ncbi:MAG TPA: SRPBCC family protein [Acidimicrobiales bacterium]|nr:SRPBCC family protein [Acidimicrobiales bacterium]
MTTAADLVGDEDDFLPLAVDEVVLAAPVEVVWAAVEGDAQERFLRTLSKRFVARDVLEELPDGYRCRTTSKVRLGSRRSFDSVVLLDEPHRSVEVQRGQRTHLRYTTWYEPVDGDTLVRCEQSYRALRASLESTAAVGALHQRAVSVLAERLAAMRRVIEAG